jgi:hypothetical protein
LVSFHPSKTVPKCQCPHAVNNDHYTIHIITIAATLRVLVLCLLGSPLR